MVMVTKREAVRALMRGAIRSLREGDNVCALTLAGAAEGAMPPVEETTLFQHVRDAIAKYRDVSEKDAARSMNKERNWLKHYDKNDPSHMNICNAMTMMLRAYSIYKILYGLDNCAIEVLEFIEDPGQHWIPDDQ